MDRDFFRTHNTEEELLKFLAESLVSKKGEEFLHLVTFQVTRCKRHRKKVKVEAYLEGDLVASTNVDRYGNMRFNGKSHS